MNQNTNQMTKVIKNELFESLSRMEFNIRETLMVLQHNKGVYWSWGVEKLCNYYNKGIVMIVNGHHHKGIVYIRLSWDDTYSYFLINEDGTIKKSVDNIYFEELQNSIDRDIEYIKIYSK